MAYTYEYPRPAFAADCVILAQDPQNNWKILLIERGNEPFKGQWALPGGFVEPNESADEAAQRELQEETGVSNVQMTQIGAFSQPGRDPRGWVVSVAFGAIVQMADCQPVAADDASRAEWISLSEIGEMAFDHRLIIQQALKKLGIN
ncbi:MAG: NUDIX hydrolase [Microscillaceae bacterium]|jgi:8-oxo-dGTP diphosphatase|nr:NUDIX hydrolase [Microscillaceae bacterium]